MMTDSRSILARLQREGWEPIRIRGSHHVLRQPATGAIVIVPHPKMDRPIGTVRNIHRAAGWFVA